MKKKSEESADAYYDKKPEKVNVYEASEGVKGLTPKLQYTEHKKMSPQEFGQHIKASTSKTSGWYSEVIGSNVNPLNIIGNPAAALAAYLTPTRSLKEQAQADKSTWSNVLIPGKGSYNRWKRLGTTIRGPEINAERRELRNKKRTPVDTGATDILPIANEAKAANAFDALAFGRHIQESLARNQF